MKDLKDTQSESDERNLPINRVGVKSLYYPIEVKDKANDVQSTVAKVSLAVDLPHQYKGTHMSRFVEILNAQGSRLSVKDMSAIPLELLDKLEAERSHVVFEFPFFLTKSAPESGAIGVMDYQVTFELNASKEKVDFLLTVNVPVTTLCPCSKAISARGAHNQRSMVTFTVRFKDLVWIEDLIRLVESCASSELYSLLKRPDEKTVTERAYDNPVFVEDLVRDVAMKSNTQENILWYRVEAENFESIHNHNAYAMIEKS